MLIGLLVIGVAVFWWVAFRPAAPDFSRSGQSGLARKADALIGRFGPGAEVRETAYRMWHTGDRSEAIELLRIAAAASGDRPNEFIANTRLLGQYLSWSGDEVESRRCFEAALSAIVEMTEFSGGEFTDAYSAAISIAGPMAAEGRGEEMLSYLRFLRLNRHKLDPSWARHVLYHEAKTLTSLGRASEAADLLADHESLLLAGAPSDRIAAAEAAITAFDGSPPQARAVDFLGKVWADPVARQSSEISSIGMAWVTRLARSGRREESLHAGIEVFREVEKMLAESDGGIVADDGDTGGGIQAEMSRRSLRNRWMSLISMLQPAYERGYPEYSLEVNMSLAGSLPRGSKDHMDVMEEIARLTRVIEAGQTQADPIRANP